MEELAKLAKLTFNVPYVDYTITVHSATILTSWAVMALMFIVGWLSVRHLKQIPDRRQVVLEMLIRSFDETIRESIGEDGRKFIPFIATLFVYILLSNWASLIPRVQSPTADLNTCLGLGVLVLIVAHIYAIRKKGLFKYIKAYFEPAWYLFPANVFSEVSKTLSHSFRLFGNIFAGGLLVALVPYLLMRLFDWWGVGLGIVLMPVLNGFFGLFIGAVQALVFALLAVAYIGVLSQ